ncbi:MAG TPA: NaeI family type II restriction endonuclease [Hyphomicrobium sp.]|nr:NaeI family type II restriction endonuclease [Hyphomicrobium sp.]
MSSAFPQSLMGLNHSDYPALSKIRDGIFKRTGGELELQKQLPILMKQAVDFVLDPVRTGRTRVEELDKVEKTFIGLKIEHYLRDWLDVPKGLRRDLLIDGDEVDIKNTIGSSWMIPPETYRNEEPCLLIATAKFDGKCSLGLVLARDSYLTSPKGNRDGKRSLSASGKQHIMWLVQELPYPTSSWDGIDMARFRELRRVRGGTKRAAQFFRENIGRRVHRSVVEALLFDQRDCMKRVRGNGGARDDLRKEGILILSGVYDGKAAATQGISLARDEFVSVKVG